MQVLGFELGLGNARGPVRRLVRAGVLRDRAAHVVPAAHAGFRVWAVRAALRGGWFALAITLPPRRHAICVRVFEVSCMNRRHAYVCLQ